MRATRTGQFDADLRAYAGWVGKDTGEPISSVPEQRGDDPVKLAEGLFGARANVAKEKVRPPRRGLI